MKKILLISPNNVWLTRECESRDTVRFLLDYMINNNIPCNSKIRDEHKLLLDISRNGYLAVISDKDNANVYVGSTITESQLQGYERQALNNKVINCYDWYDTTDEYNGYNTHEYNGGGTKAYDLSVEEIILRKPKTKKRIK